MTLAARPRVNEYQGLPAPATFAVHFQFFAPSELDVVLRDAAGVERPAAGYTVTGGEGAKGQVEFATVSTSGFAVVIRGATKIDQQSQIPEGGKFPTATIERGLDRGIAIAQEQRDLIEQTVDRALILPPGEIASTLPKASDRAGKLQGYDAAGAPYMVDPSTVATPLPGGLATVISLFALASSISIPVGTDYVQTAGWSARGRGGAYYVYDPTVDAAYVTNHPRTAFTSKNGRGFRLAESVIDPAQVGASATGQTDDTAAVQASFDTGLSVTFAPGRTYLISSPLRIASDGVSVTGAARIKIAPNWNFAADTDSNGTHLRVIFVTGNFVTIDGVNFDMTGVTPGTAVENGFIWSTAIGTKVTDCQFVGCSKGTCFWALSAYSSFTGNSVFDCTGAVFARGRNPVINDNTIINATDAAIAINGTPCVGAVISNNTISNETGVPIPSMIAVEESASRWTITGNTLIGVNGGGIMCINVLVQTQVAGGTIVGNDVSAFKFDGTLPNGANPAALLSISPAYTDWIVAENAFRGLPAGNTNSRSIIIPATGGVFVNNIVDTRLASGLVSTGLVLAGTGGLTIRGNKFLGIPPANPNASASYQGRGLLFAAGAYGNMPIKIVGNAFHNFREGINSDLSSGNMTGFLLHIDNIEETSCLFTTACLAAIGTRSNFLNDGAVLRPHRIGVYTDMCGDGTPTAAGTLSYQAGDRINTLTPTGTSRMGVWRVGGAWVDFPYIPQASGAP